MIMSVMLFQLIIFLGIAGLWTLYYFGVINRKINHKSIEQSIQAEIEEIKFLKLQLKKDIEDRHQKIEYSKQFLSCKTHGLYLAEKQWCSWCRDEAMDRPETHQFTVICACPQCGHINNHEWVGHKSFKLTKNGIEENKGLVIRKCLKCQWEWDQS